MCSFARMQSRGNKNQDIGVTLARLVIKRRCFAGETTQLKLFGDRQRRRRRVAGTNKRRFTTRTVGRSSDACGTRPGRRAPQQRSSVVPNVATMASCHLQSGADTRSPRARERRVAAAAGRVHPTHGIALSTRGQAENAKIYMCCASHNNELHQQRPARLDVIATAK